MKMRNNMFKTALFVNLILALLCTLQGGENLLKNGTFASVDGIKPAEWSIGNSKAFQTRDGILRISGKTESYAAYVSQTVKIEGGKDYFLYFEIKSDQLEDGASCIYSIFGADKKPLAKDRGVFVFHKAPIEDWIQVGFKVPASRFNGAAAMSVGFVVYNRTKAPRESDNGICIRNIRLEEYSNQTLVSIRAKRKAPAPAAAAPNAAAVPAAVDNLLKNPAFESADGIQPSGWSIANKIAYQAGNGVMRISEKSGSYASYFSQTIPVESGKSYFFSAEIKADLLEDGAGCVYSIYDGNRKALQKDKRIFWNYHGPQSEWVKFSSVIPVASFPGAKTLSIGFIVYNKTKKPRVEDNALYIRNPRLVLFSSQTPVSLKAPVKKNIKEMPSNPFPENFTGAPLGTTYRMERGGVGFLRLNSGIMPRKEVTLKVETAEGVNVELYMWLRSKGICLPVPEIAPGTFKVGPEYDWLIWGNSLLFTVGEKTPNDFEIKMTFTCGERTVSYAVPVSIIGEVKAGKLPKWRRFNSWQSYPVMRFDVSGDNLAAKLDKYWKQAGWNHVPFAEIDRVIPFRRDIKIDCAPAVDVTGAPVNLYCDTAWVAKGPEYFKGLITKSASLLERIRNAKRAHWDYEPYVVGPVTMSCFCRDCLAAFTSVNGLPANIPPMEILKKHRRAWVDFRCRQRAEAVRVVAEAVKLIDPGYEFLLCTMPIAPEKDEDYEELYGIRSTLFDPCVDIFTSMNYASTLNYFRSLERENTVLKKERRTYASNGWGHERVNDAKRPAMHVLAAFFCGEKVPAIAQGLYVTQCSQIAELRRVMEYIARTEDTWDKGVFTVEKRKLNLEYNGDANIYALERKSADGTSFSLVFNNSDIETAYASLDYDEDAVKAVTDVDTGKRLFTKNGKAWLKMEPLSYIMVRFSPEKSAAPAYSGPDVEAENAKLFDELSKKLSSQEKYGITYRNDGKSCIIGTPVQQMEFNLTNSGEAQWKAGDRILAHLIGADIFMDRGAFPLAGNRVTMENVDLQRDRAVVKFSFRLVKPPYDGLVIRKEYSIMRNSMEFSVRTDVVPDGGFRMFRLRTINNFAMVQDDVALAAVSEYVSEKVVDNGAKHISFVRKGALFPNDKPFLGKYISQQYPLESGVFSVRQKTGDMTFTLTAKGLDQMFCWRSRQAATLEPVWADAYPRNDPHLVRTWTAEYSVKAERSKETK